MSCGALCEGAQIKILILHGLIIAKPPRWVALMFYFFGVGSQVLSSLRQLPGGGLLSAKTGRLVKIINDTDETTLIGLIILVVLNLLGSRGGRVCQGCSHLLLCIYTF